MGVKETGKRISISFNYRDGFTKYIHGDNIDELIDGLELLKDEDLFDQFISKFENLSEEQWKRLDNIILTMKDASKISWYAYNRKKVSNVKAFEDTLIELKDIMAIIRFTEAIAEASVDRMTEGLIKNKDAYAIMEFYQEIEGVDSEKIKQALFELQNSEYICVFFEVKMRREEEITQDDISKAEEIILNSKEDNKMSTIISWAANIKGANISVLEDIIIESKIPIKIRLFAEEVTGADIKKLENAIIETKDACNMFHFATNVKDADIDRFIKAIKETNDEYYIKLCKSKFGRMKVFFA